MSSAPATGTEPDGEQPTGGEVAGWVLKLLQAGDSFYPTGSYAHSFGLEGVVDLGLVHDRATLRSFLLEAALPNLRHSELPLVALGWRAIAAGNWPQVGELSALASALKTTKEARIASENIGRQRAEMAAELHPGSVASEYLLHAKAGGWPMAASIAAAVEARTHGTPLEAALAASAYASLAALIAAAMKLLRLGQNGAQSLLVEMLTEVPQIIEEAKTASLDDIGWSNPWLDIASARHEFADARMFIS